MDDLFNFALGRLEWPEGPLVERKAETDHKDWPRTLVAFANSTPPNERALMFIGASDTKPHKGIKSEKAVDEIQRKIAEIAEDKCYPPISIEFVHVPLKQEGMDCHILAVIVPHSPSRPHFAGPAYVRIGSKSPPASEKIYKELIAAHNTLAGQLQRWKGQQVEWKLVGSNQMYLLGNATIRDVTGVSATLQDDATGQGHPISLTDIAVLDRDSLRPVLEVKYWASDRELMEWMLNRWSFFVSTNPEQYHPQYDYLSRQVDLHSELFEPVARAMIQSKRASKLVEILHIELLERLGKEKRVSVAEIISNAILPIVRR